MEFSKGGRPGPRDLGFTKGEKDQVDLAGERPVVETTKTDKQRFVEFLEQGGGWEGKLPTNSRFNLLLGKPRDFSDLEKRLSEQEKKEAIMEAFRFSLVNNQAGRSGALLQRFEIIYKEESVEFYVGVIKEILEKPWLGYSGYVFTEGLSFALFRVRKIDAGAVEKELPELPELIKNKLVGTIDDLYSSQSGEPQINLGSERTVLYFLISSFRLSDSVLRDKKVIDALGRFQSRAEKLKQTKDQAQFIQIEARRVLDLFE